MHKTIVVYVTRSGNAKKLAEMLALLAGTTAVQIVDLVNRKGFFGYMRAGFHASTKKATPIRDPLVDLSSADTVVMVQPIWASGVVPPLRTWLRSHESELRDKRLGLFTVCKGSDASAVKLAFEAEFRPLSAFGGAKEADDEATRRSACAAFVAALG